jgi:prepilin-type N-terminal cleavage/methylation domain-containing protein
MKKSHGFTVVELMIVMTILGVLSVGIIWGFGSCSPNSGVEEEARNYAKSLGLNVEGVSCTKYDTDHDGYISCSVSYKEDNKLVILPIECAVGWRKNDGCRSPKTIIRRGLFGN